ncbi:MAG: NAD(P)-binding domain-containing protein [Boseongicola sp.]
MGPVKDVTAIVIGGGHAGLAVSKCLTDRNVEHIVLERGEVANSWKTERWDSLRLLTPNWQSRLPGFVYDGDDPDEYRTMPEVIDFLEKYARTIAAPIQTGAAVTAVRPNGRGYQVATDGKEFACRAVVLATGACAVPTIPALAGNLHADILSLHSRDYRNPRQIPDGGVMIVGASATGTQIAMELQRAGHKVTLSVGEHIRAPRTYRGRDLEWWMDQSGMWDETYQEVEDIRRARSVPSLQLAGTPDRTTLDLNALTDIDVRIVGRLVGLSGDVAQFSGSLLNQCTLSDLKMNRLLGTLDDWAEEDGYTDQVGAIERFEPTRVPEDPPLTLDLATEDIRTVLWATGFKPDHSFLEVPVFDRKARILHDGGVVNAPGLYLMGLQFMRRRKSALIDGAAADAADISDHLVQYLKEAIRPAAGSTMIN